VIEKRKVSVKAPEKPASTQAKEGVADSVKSFFPTEEEQEENGTYGRLCTLSENR
jgi:hypothetical protein